MGTALWPVLKMLDLFRLLENETMETFSVRVRNKSKQIRCNEREYLSPEIQNEDFG